MSEHAIGEPAELASLYLAGAMTTGEVAEFEAHLALGCALCGEEVRKFGPVAAAMAEPAAPPAHIRESLLRSIREEPQVWRRWASGTEEGLFTLRANDGGWEPTGLPGVRVRKLSVDRERNEMVVLVRMDAGASYPRHRHAGPEHCLVLEGDLRIGDSVLKAGDYQRASEGHVHPVQTTEGGCTCLIVSSLSDEIF